MLSKILENLGLNNKEACVYLAALEIGSNPVSKIAAKAKLNRVTAYDIIEKLVKKGLVSSFTRAKVKYFTATEPQAVVTDFQRKVGELHTSLPELQRLSGETVHPRVRYFEGLDGIRHIYEDTLNSKTEILNYGDSEEIRRHWPTYDQDYVAKRADKKIFLRGITLDDAYGTQVVAKNNEYYRDIRLVSKDKFNFTNEIHIYDDKVAIISYKDELIGMIIESPEIANTQRAIFKMVWEFISQKSDAIEDTSMLEGFTEDNQPIPPHKEPPAVTVIEVHESDKVDEVHEDGSDMQTEAQEKVQETAPGEKTQDSPDCQDLPNSENPDDIPDSDLSREHQSLNQEPEIAPAQTAPTGITPVAIPPSETTLIETDPAEINTKIAPAATTFLDRNQGQLF